MNKPFTNTDYYKKAQSWKHNQQTYWMISPFGDGNCGLYAFACGLIDLIITDKLTLSNQQFSDFRNEIM